MAAPEQRLLPLLRGVVADSDGHWRAYCPIHEQNGHHDPSLSITRGQDGRLLLHCFVCGPDVRGHEFCYAVGMSLSELYPDSPHGRRGGGRRQRGRIVETYDYIDADGVIRYQCCRFEPKAFGQRRPRGDGGWIWNLRGVSTILYRLPQLLAADPEQRVLIVEGERKADRLIEMGFIATASPMGAGKWKRQYGAALRDRDIIILPDNDQPGRDHAAKIILALSGIARSVRILELPDLAPREDVVDWLDAGGTRERLLELMASSPAAETPPEPRQVILNDPLSLLFEEARNDAANGRRFARDYGQSSRYCHPWGKWFVFDGRRWAEDQTAATDRQAKLVSYGLWFEARRLMQDGQVDDGTFQKIMKFAQFSCSSQSITSTLKTARSEPGLQIVPAEMDADPWLLNCQNGTLDLRNGTLREHFREDFLTKICSTSFDPAAECPTWERFLASIFDDNVAVINYVQRLCGYYLTGVIREQILTILWGNGSNGKTTFLNTVMEVLGDGYSMKTPTDFLMAKRNDAHPTEKADLFGKRLAACSETDDGRRLNEPLVKELTGTERVRARRMREDFWEFPPTHKIVMSTNHKPVISGTDVGMWRRLRLIPFEKCFWNPDSGQTGPEHLRQDKDIGRLLIEERIGILTWMVRGCMDWLHNGEQVPPEVIAATAVYQSSQDVVGTFFSECCVLGEAFSTSASTLYEHYRSWCESHGEYAVNQRKFGLCMTERGFDRYANNGVWYRRIGIMVNSNS